MATASFDSLPIVVAENIASFLHGQELVNLGFTCKFWYDIAHTNHVWKLLVERRYGGQIQVQDAALDFEMDYKMLCIELSLYRKAATEFTVQDLNGYGLELQQDPESECGEIVQLNAVSSLQIHTEFTTVVPGKYRLIWRMKLDNVYLSCNHVAFIARPEEFCGSEVCSICGHSDLTTAECNIGSNRWFEADMGQFVVTSLCKVFVEIKSRSDYLCSGMSWDYAELRPITWYENSESNISRKFLESEQQQVGIQESKETLCILF